MVRLGRSPPTHLTPCVDYQLYIIQSKNQCFFKFFYLKLFTLIHFPFPFHKPFPNDLSFPYIINILSTCLGLFINQRLYIHPIKKLKTMKEKLFHIRDTIRIIPAYACFSMYSSDYLALQLLLFRTLRLRCKDMFLFYPNSFILPTAIFHTIMRSQSTTSSPSFKHKSIP